METKKYYAEDMPAAMEQIKRELGSDAIIIKSRKIKQKYGPLGLFHKSLYEVVVSCEPEQPPFRRKELSAREQAAPVYQRPASPKPSPKRETIEKKDETASESFTPMRPERFAQLVQTSGERLEEPDEDMLRVLAAVQVAEQPAAVTPAAKLGAYAAVGSGRSNGAGPLPAPQAAASRSAASSAPAPAPAAPVAAEEAAPAPPVKRGRGRPRKYPVDAARPAAANVPPGKTEQAAIPAAAEAQTLARLDALERTMREIRQKLTEPLVQREAKKPSAPPEGPGRELGLDALLGRLEAQDVDQASLEILTQKARERMEEGAAAYEALCGALEAMLGKPRYLRAAKNKPRCIMFIGPTGVGKTTTLVKLVSSCVFERGAKAGIINADVFRVGAQDQLGAYASILGVPMATIYDSQEIQEAIASFAGSDFVFIDTSGKAPQDPEYQAELSKLIKLGDIQEIYLTVSSTTSGRICRQIIKEYEDIGPYRVVVTKLDESGSYGAAVNLCQASGQPLSYITTGQNVPEDIRRAEVGEIIADLLR